MSNSRNSRNSRNSSNGRISLAPPQPPNTMNLFQMYDKNRVKHCTTLQEPMGNQWEDTVLSKAFFSKENIQIIQNGIRAGVYAKSNKQYVINPVSCDTLKNTMQSVFEQYAANQPTNITEQIQNLNQIVLNHCIFHAYSEAQGYLRYLQDISSPLTIMAHPTLERQRDKNNYTMPNWFSVYKPNNK